MGSVGGSAHHPRTFPTMRTALIALIVLVRFGPDFAYAMHQTLPEPDTSRQTVAPKWIVSPPAVVVIRPLKP